MRAGITIAILSLAAAGVAGFMLGAALPSANKQHDSPPFTAIPQTAPQPLAPTDRSEFVDSDLTLSWRWDPGLAENKRYALRLWTGDQPFRELWTVDDSVNIQELIDSFSFAIGSYFWQVAVVDVDESGAFASMGSEWSATFELRRRRRLSIQPKAIADMSAAARAIAERDLSADEKIDAAHRFVSANSINDEQAQFGADYSDAIEQMTDYAEGRRADRPHLQCDGRSTAMLTILRELGIESRLVFLYAPVPGYLAQHTVLEVFNPERQRWQTHDLAWDFYYIDARRRDRVSAERILYGASDSLDGCPIAGGVCSPAAMAQSIGYFAALRYGYTYEVWVNPDRFEISTRFEGQDQRNLAEFIGDGEPQRVAIRMKQPLTGTD